jgi:hypothetical protein
MNISELRTVAKAALLCLGASLTAYAQSPSTEEVLRRAAANEEKLRAAERDYTYRQSILVQTLGQYGRITGEIRRVSDVITDDLGSRTEKILEYPPSRLATTLGVARPDFKSLLGVDPFFLTPDTLPRYQIKFVEREKVGDINSFVFEVETSGPRPKSSPKDDRPFNGRIWIDDHDFQIVKAEGKAVTVKDDSNQFPKFEYYRAYVDGKWWLPSAVLARDLLEFKRYDLSIKVEIKYTDYKRVQSRR